MSAEDLNRLYIKATKSFYLRPKYILQQLFKIRSIEDIKRTVIAAKAVIGL